MSLFFLSRLAYGKYPQTIGRAKRNKAGEMTPMIIEDHARTALAPPRKLDATERLERALQGIVDDAADRILTLEIEIRNREDELADVELAMKVSGDALRGLLAEALTSLDAVVSAPASSAHHLAVTLRALASAQGARVVILDREIEDRRRELSDVRDAHAAALAGLAALPSRIEAVCAEAILEEIEA